jgi:hypothetical protein
MTSTQPDKTFDLGELVAEATRLIRSVHGTDNIPGIPYPLTTMREVDYARALRHLLDAVARLSEERVRLEGERDDADRRAGAASRRLEWLEDDVRKSRDWMDERKAEVGIGKNDPFDKAWKVLVARAERAEAERDVLKARVAELEGVSRPRIEATGFGDVVPTIERGR